MSLKLKTAILLLSATVIWGLSYPISRYALNDISPWAFSGFRYMFGSLALLPIAVRWGRRQALADYYTHSLRSSRWLWLWGGLCAGLLLSIGSGFQYYGLTDTTASKSGFITGLYVSMVPLFGFILGQIPGRPVWIGLMLGFIGLFFISNPGSSEGFTRGDSLTFVADIFWAVHVLVMGYFAVRVNTWRFVTCQASVCCILCFVMSYVSGSPPTLLQLSIVWPFTLWGIMSVGVAYVCQAFAQKNTAASAAALLMQLQSVIGCVCGVVFLGETMTVPMIFGALLMISSSLVAQSATEPKRLTTEHPYFRGIQIARVLLVILILIICFGAVAFTEPMVSV